MIEIVINYWSEILGGVLRTLAIVSAGFLAGSLAGLALGPLRDARWRLVRFLAGSFVEFIRNTPLLIQASLLFAFAGVMRLRIEPELIGTLSVAIYTSAYMAEIARGALNSIAAGQWEAANSLGLRKLATFRLVILPQLLPYGIPASANLLATITKESAFLSAVSVSELTFTGQVIIAQTFAVFEVWAIIGLLYLMIILSLLECARRMENRMGWSRDGQ